MVERNGQNCQFIKKKIIFSSMGCGYSCFKKGIQHMIPLCYMQQNDGMFQHQMPSSSVQQ